MEALRRKLDNERWHFQHGPIDLIIGVEGDSLATEAAHEAAWVRFQQVLAELAGELPVLRCAVQPGGHCPVQGPVARRMWQACAPLSADFITPMAAVAGAVAEELIAFYRGPGIHRAWVNNGGDIALHLTPGTQLAVGLVADVQRAAIDGRFVLRAELPVRGIATSGWQGRSFSLGIADSVTVLARCAADADAAATMIANAVNVDDDGIVRRPANTLKDDTDLGDRPVTVEVGTLSPAAVDAALAAGVARAGRMLDRGLILAASLWLQGRSRLVCA